MIFERKEEYLIIGMLHSLECYTMHLKKAWNDFFFYNQQTDWGVISNWGWKIQTTLISNCNIANKGVFSNTCITTISSEFVTRKISPKRVWKSCSAKCTCTSSISPSFFPMFCWSSQAKTRNFNWSHFFNRTNETHTLTSSLIGWILFRFWK